MATDTGRLAIRYVGGPTALSTASAQGRLGGSVRAVADRVGPVDVAVLFAGAARTALAGGAYLTLTSQAAAEAARLLGARAVVPLHFEGWAHFTQGRETLVAAFARAGLGDRLHLPAPGGAELTV